MLRKQEEFLKSENKPSDERILADVTWMYYNDVDKQQHPINFYRTLVEAWGKLDDPETYKKYAKHVFEKTMIFDDAKWNAFIKNPDGTVLQSDPAYAHASAFLTNYQSKYMAKFQQFQTKMENWEIILERYNGNGSCKSKKNVSGCYFNYESKFWKCKKLSAKRCCFL